MQRRARVQERIWDTLELVGSKQPVGRRTKREICAMHKDIVVPNAGKSLHGGEVLLRFDDVIGE